MPSSLGWLTSIRTRPLLPWWDAPEVDSLLAKDRASLFFASGNHMQVQYTEVAARIRIRGVSTWDCCRVGTPPNTRSGIDGAVCAPI